MSEKLPEREIAEILPAHIGQLSARESGPLLSRAASRIDILRPKNEFWEGMKDNLRGASAWIDAKKGEISSKTLRAVAGASLVATMVAACAKPPETTHIPTEAPRITEVIPTETPLPTEAPTQILTETPTLEPTPTPTEVPMYTGPLVDAQEWNYREIPKIFDNNIDGHPWNFYMVSFLTRLTLVSTEDLPGASYYMPEEPAVTEHIWGFNLQGQDYRFRVDLTYCVSRNQNDDGWIGSGYWESVMDAPLQIGKDYAPDFIGLNEPLTDEQLGVLPDYCQDIYRPLIVDSQNKERLLAFFRRGNTEGFPVDENGIVDLSGYITEYNNRDIFNNP